jgi:hypothetical protein
MRNDQNADSDEVGFAVWTNHKVVIISLFGRVLESGLRVSRVSARRDEARGSRLFSRHFLLAFAANYSDFPKSCPGAHLPPRPSLILRAPIGSCNLSGPLPGAVDHAASHSLSTPE